MMQDIIGKVHNNIIYLTSVKDNRKPISHLVQICAQIEKLSKLILSIKFSAKASYIM